MIFPAFDPFDSADQQNLRRVSLESLRSIAKMRSEYIEGCDARTGLSDLDRNGRMIFFGALLTAAREIVTAGLKVGDDAETFVQSFTRPADDEKPMLRLMRHMFGDRNAENDIRERHRYAVMTGLMAVPGFDRDAFFARRDQPVAFFEAFKIDFPVLSGLTEEIRKPYRCMIESESAIETLRPIYDRFEITAFTGVDIDAVIALHGVDDEQMDPFVDTEIDLEPSPA